VFLAQVPVGPVVSIAHREEGKPLILAGSAKNKLYCVSYPERISHWDANVGGEPSVIETVDIDGGWNGRGSNRYPKWSSMGHIPGWRWTVVSRI